MMLAPRPLPHSCASAGRVTASLLLSFLVLSPAPASGLSSTNGLPAPIVEPQVPIVIPGGYVPDQPREHAFTLRNIFHHGTHAFPGLHRQLDIPPETALWVETEDDAIDHQPGPGPLSVKDAPLRIQRLADRKRESIDSLLEVGRMTGSAVDLPLSAWTEDDIAGPNVTDQETVLSFARMAADAYVIDPSDPAWKHVGGGFNYTEDFGWQSDGLRGHIFADTENRTVVIGLKGTSPAVFDGSETTTNDKVNDNLFFSCCCGQGGQFMWKQVCDCQTNTYQCNSTCLTHELREKNRYYYAAQDLYHNVTALYPDADIWVTGHSLGGSVSSLLGLTFGLPVVTFEAVPEAMPAKRLGLPVPPGDSIGSMHQARANTGGYHFGHTADPVYMGVCNTATASCTIGGYAMQSVCHTGYKCVYDTVKDFGWRVGIGTHKIVNVISQVIKAYDAPPTCQQYKNCSDCFLWEYYESNGTETTTTMPKPTSSSYSRTRTSTCKTPGWWGCLDESTTGKATTTASSISHTLTSTSTSTCKTPGWFGCLDETSTTTTTSTSSATPAPTVTTTSTEPTSTSSCAHPGFFGGCYDDDSTAVLTSSPTLETSAPLSTPVTSTCTSKKWLGLKCADHNGAEGHQGLRR